MTELVNNYLSKHKVHIIFDETWIAHYFVPRDGVIQTYVYAADGENISDLFSFYLKRCLCTEEDSPHPYFT